MRLTCTLEAEIIHLLTAIAEKKGEVKAYFLNNLEPRSTEENRIEDLEIMFPFHRYMIIKNMAELPRVLSHFYLKITT